MPRYNLCDRAVRLRTNFRRLVLEQLEERIVLDTGVLDTIPNTLAEAAILTLDAGGNADFAGRIQQAGDVDDFRFTANFSGTLLISQSAALGSGLDPFLRVFDANETQIAFDDDSGVGTNSMLTIQVVAGQSYFVQAGAFSTSTGAYDLRLRADEAPNVPQISQAVAIALDANNGGQQLGAIQVAGDVDVYKIVASTSSIITIRQEATAGSNLDSVLSVFNASGSLLASNDDSGGSLNSEIQLLVAAGQTYLVQAGAYSSSTGNYRLTFTGTPLAADDFGNDFADASGFVLGASGFGQINGRINVAADVDMFRLLVPVSGDLNISLVPEASLDGVLRVFDGNGNLLQSRDAGFTGGTETVQVHVAADQVIFIQASGYLGSTGNYQLRVATLQAPADDVGNTMAAARILPLTADGAGTVKGNIESAGDVDMYRIDATFTGGLAIAQNAFLGGSLDTYLRVYNSAGVLITENDDHSSTNSLVEFAVTAGETYFVEAGAYGTNIGEYVLSVRQAPLDDFPGVTLADAYALNVTPRSATTVHGAIERAGDVDLFRFVAPFTGQLTIDQGASAGSGLDSYLHVFDNTGAEIAFDDDSGPGLDSQVVLNVVAGQTYYVRAGAYISSTGAYNLTFSRPLNFGEIRVNATGTAGNQVTTEYSHSSVAMNDSGNFVVVWTDFYWGDGDVYAQRFDAAGNRVGNAILVAGSTNDERDPVVGIDNNGNFVVVWEETNNVTRWVEAAIYNAAGVLQRSLVLTSTAGQRYDPSVAMAGNGNWVFSYTSTVSGVDSVFYRAFDVAGNPLMGGPNSVGASNTRHANVAIDDNGNVAITVTFAASATDNNVYVRMFTVTGLAQGGFVSVATTSGFDDEDSSVAMNNAGDVVVTFAFESAPGNHNIYAVAYDFNSVLDTLTNVSGFVAVSTTSDDEIYPSVAIDDAGNFVVTYDENFGSTGYGVRARAFDALGQALGPAFTVNRTFDGNQTGASLARNGAGDYVVAWSGNGTGDSSGVFTRIFPHDAPADDFGNDAGTAGVIALTSSGAGAQSGAIETGDVDWFRFVASISGQMTIDLAAAAGSSLDGILEVLDANQISLQVHDVGGAGAAEQAQFQVVAGQTYYLRVSGYGSSNGGYDLTIRTGTPLVDESPNTFADALPIPLDGAGNGYRTGTILPAGDADVYRFVAPVNGTMVATLSAAVGSGLNAYMRAYDADFRLLGENDNAGFSRDSLMRFSVLAGRTYYIQAVSVGGTTGAYDLNLETLPFGAPGQLSILNLNHPSDANQVVRPVDLVNALFGPGSGITVVGDVHYEGSNLAAGLFTGGAGILDAFEDSHAPGYVPFNSGIVLSTGQVASQVLGNFGNDQSGNLGQAGNSILDPLAGGATHDASVLTFNFIPDANVITLRFVFGSDEYLEFANSIFNDVFGIFVNGVNYARVPDTGNGSPGSGEVISVNNLNHLRNSNLFIDNSYLGGVPLGPLSVEMDGLSRVITLQAPVRRGEVNTMTIAIADTQDFIYDSSIFIQGGTLESVAETVTQNQVNQALANFVQIQNQIIQNNPGLTEEQLHQLINQALLDYLLKELPLIGGYLVIPVDPVDFTLTTPTGQQITSTGGQVTTNTTNAFFASDGINQFIIWPNANLTNYSVSLTGVGTGDFRWACNFVDPGSGQVTSYLLQGQLAGNRSAAQVLDFRGANGGTQFVTLRTTLPNSNVASAPSGIPGLVIANAVLPLIVTIQVPNVATSAQDSSSTSTESSSATGQSEATTVAGVGGEVVVINVAALEQLIKAFWMRLFIWLGPWQRLLNIAQFDAHAAASPVAQDNEVRQEKLTRHTADLFHEVWCPPQEEPSVEDAVLLTPGLVDRAFAAEAFCAEDLAPACWNQPSDRALSDTVLAAALGTGLLGSLYAPRPQVIELPARQRRNMSPTTCK